MKLEDRGEAPTNVASGASLSEAVTCAYTVTSLRLAWRMER